MRSTNQTVEITLSADATVTHACINGGGKHLKATNKETVNGPESQPGFFNFWQERHSEQLAERQPAGTGLLLLSERPPVGVSEGQLHQRHSEGQHQQRHRKYPGHVYEDLLFVLSF